MLLWLANIIWKTYRKPGLPVKMRVKHLHRTIGCRDMKYHHFQPFFTHNSHFSHSGPSNLLWNMNYWFRIHFYDKNEGSIISVRLVVLKIWPFTFLTVFRPIWTKKGPKKDDVPRNSPINIWIPKVGLLMTQKNQVRKLPKIWPPFPLTRLDYRMLGKIDRKVMFAMLGFLRAINPRLGQI